MAALPALQPPLHARVRASARRPPPRPHPALTEGRNPRDDFLSGASGEVTGIRATARAIAADLRDDALAWIRWLPPRLRGAGRPGPPRRILALAVVDERRPGLIGSAARELARSRHHVEFDQAPVGGRGKFENLNRLLARHELSTSDWLIVVDDDVRLPRGFVDSFVFLAERFDLALAQPAHRHRSHAAWPVTRRRPAALLHETRFVEIGPVFAFHRRVFDALLPFPELRYGWGVDSHWSALALQHGWRMGVIDATPVTHAIRRTASGYDRAAAAAEARAFLAERPYVTRTDAGQVLAEHRNWRP